MTQLKIDILPSFPPLNCENKTGQGINGKLVGQSKMKD